MALSGTMQMSSKTHTCAMVKTWPEHTCETVEIQQYDQLWSIEQIQHSFTLSIFYCYTYTKEILPTLDPKNPDFL